MEAALFFIDCMLLLWLCVCAIRADRQGDPDKLDLFAYDDDQAASRAARRTGRR